MKRTKHINKTRFRKGFVLASVMVSTFALSGCEVADETVKMYQSVDECKTLDSENASQCKASFEQAKAEHEKSGPKFDSGTECASEFGSCEYNSNTNSFMPMMMGFMAGQMMGNMQANSNFRAAQPMYKSYDGSYRDKDSRNYGTIIPGQTFKTSSSAFKPKEATTSKPFSPPKASTSSRGGFGKSVSSRGSFGG